MRRFPFIHRITAWMALLGYALVASGLPLPMNAVAPVAADSTAAKLLAVKDRSRPFPCMDKPCGCASAEQCFSKCCCNTPAELLAWAKAKGVDPAVVAALEGRASAPSGVASCCTAERPTRETICCSADAEPACGADVARSACCESSPPVQPETDDAPASGRTLVLRAMLACGGIVAEWLAVGVALTPQVTACERAAEPIAALILSDETSLSERAAPEGPPPRAA